MIIHEIPYKVKYIFVNFNRFVKFIPYQHLTKSPASATLIPMVAY